MRGSDSVSFSACEKLRICNIPRKRKVRMRVVATSAAQLLRTQLNSDVSLGRPRALARAAQSLRVATEHRHGLRTWKLLVELDSNQRSLAGPPTGGKRRSASV